jgi:hypothetical protein
MNLHKSRPSNFSNSGFSTEHSGRRCRHLRSFRMSVPSFSPEVLHTAQLYSLAHRFAANPKLGPHFSFVRFRSPTLLRPALSSHVLLANCLASKPPTMRSVRLSSLRQPSPRPRSRPHRAPFHRRSPPLPPLRVPACPRGDCSRQAAKDTPPRSCVPQDCRGHPNTSPAADTKASHPHYLRHHDLLHLRRQGHAGRADEALNKPPVATCSG